MYMTMQSKKWRLQDVLYVVFCDEQNRIYSGREKDRKKSKKTFKKVLTKRVVRGIIVKRSRETAKNKELRGSEWGAGESAQDLEN